MTKATEQLRKGIPPSKRGHQVKRATTSSEGEHRELIRIEALPGHQETAQGRHRLAHTLLSGMQNRHLLSLRALNSLNGQHQQYRHPVKVELCMTNVGESPLLHFLALSVKTSPQTQEQACP